jgi:hypothetical protein
MVAWPKELVELAEQHSRSAGIVDQLTPTVGFIPSGVAVLATVVTGFGKVPVDYQRGGGVHNADSMFLGLRMVLAE